MENHEAVKTIIEVAIIYVIVTCIFSVLSTLCLLIIRDHNNTALKMLLNSSAIWIAVVCGIVAALLAYAKKLNIKISLGIKNNRIVNLAVGLLISIEALRSLSGTLFIRISSIKSALQASQLLSQTNQGMITQSMIINLTAIILLLFQFALGVYFIRRYKKISN